MERKERSSDLAPRGWRSKALRIGTIFGIAVVLLIVTTAVGWRIAGDSRLCLSCHEMRPETVTWMASSHNQVSCTVCHKPNYLNMLNQDIKKQYLLPIEQPQPTPDAICNQCHDMTKRVVTPSGDIKISHVKHLAQKVSCVECHSGVAHGNIVRRQETIDGVFNRWTSAVGKVQMSPRFTALGMKQCLECHQENNVQLSCESCHSKIVLPENHKPSTWVDGEHGQAAKKDITACDDCHSYTKENQIIAGLDSVTEYARTNTFCYKCHAKAPPSHDAKWRATHGTKANAARQDCLVCHSSSRPKATDYAAKTYCQQCHQANHATLNRANHPVPLPTGSKLVKSCTNCHPSGACLTCHVISD